MRVSLALATYNGAAFLAEQLQSLAAQTHRPFELIVQDDRSTDETLAVVAAFAATAPFPVHVASNPERLGYRANFMAAAGRCQGDLIGFCDQDDVWYPHKLATVVARFDDPQVMLVHHNARLVTAAGQPLGRIYDWDGVRDTDTGPMGASPWRFPQGFAMTFRPELLALSGFRERSVDYLSAYEALAHDQWIYLLALVFGRVRFVAEALVDYRQHDTNAYGISRRHKSRLDLLNEKFEKFSNYTNYARASRTIATLLREASPDLQAPLAPERALAAAERFDELEALYRQRAEAYSAPSPVARASAWLALARAGRYGAAPGWSFDREEIVRDFVLGVCLAKLRRRTGKDPFRDWSLRVGRPAR